jgi:Rps23 Pro-64 3,4-dihydroxylase Tpa1-like proline 4-hydroxylase
MPGPAPRVLIFDDFLPEELAADIRRHALAGEKEFVASAISSGRIDPTFRRSLSHAGALGHLTAPFERAVRKQASNFASGVGVPAFQFDSIELELVVHCDGGLYRPHVDTGFGPEHESLALDRLISAVYYCHCEPKRFSGGELAIFTFGNLEPAHLIEPVANRLVAFPSFALHEVRPVRCHGGDFADSRFSVSCWLGRARDRI